ncbi:MAG: UDP-N-acetylmuramate dehydrogenase [Christensenellales bacterium]
MKTDPGERFFSRLPAEAVSFDAPLSNYTTIKVGGPARFLMEARDVREISEAIKAARAAHVPLLVIGKGSNLLIQDEGFDGLVIHFGEAFSQVEVLGSTIIAQAGASLPGVARLAADKALSGLEFAAGIPASVGGAALMNCGAYGGEISRVIKAVDCLDRNGDPLRLQWEDICYGYRSSRLMNEGFIVLSVEMALIPADRDEVWARLNEHQAQRRAKQPLTWPSAGSFFKRPEGHFAGALIEQAGLKGFRVGDAAVSQLHAGFLINEGQATAKDFFLLAEHIQQTVERVFGVKLEPEVQIIRSPKP